jgi:hypothetical protein
MVATAETASGLSVRDEPPTLRAFGRDLADLDCDFQTGYRLVLAAAIVAACASENADAALALPVSVRVARLLRIAQLTTDADALLVALKCSAAECGRALEVSLSFEHLLEVSAGESSLRASIPGGAELQLRRPTGRDQLAWRAENFRTQREALAQVVQTLTISAPAAVEYDDAAIAALAAAMEEFDPLIAFRVLTACPHCGLESVFAIDLEAEALRLLATHSRTLIREVHALATQYGWTEAEIIGLSPRRRAHYLQLIAETSGALSP